MDATNRRLVAYYRVSTERQGQSRLGLEAQYAAVAAFVAQQRGAELIASYKEVETGKRNTLANRPELQKAIAHAKRSKAVLVIAKLDRLARSVYVTAMLMHTGIEFIAVDNPHANRMTIQILAVFAEHEAKVISERTRDALAAYKKRGGQLGGQRPKSRNLTQNARKRGAMTAGEVVHAQKEAAYADLVPIVSSLRTNGLTLQQIASRLNDMGHTTRTGKSWSHVQVSRVLSMGTAS